MQEPDDSQTPRRRPAAKKAGAAPPPATKKAGAAPPPATKKAGAAPRPAAKKAGAARRPAAKKAGAAPHPPAPPEPIPPPQPIPRADRPNLMVRRLRRVIAGLLVLGLCGFLIEGASRPANPALVPALDPGAAKGSPPFGTATLSVDFRHGTPACVLEAVTPRQHAAGLMNRTTLAPYAGMAFVFAAPSTDRFYMKNTLISLSIAWFDAGGRFESEAVMAPCPVQTVACPTYGPDRAYVLAVEVPAGRLASMGIGPGSTVQLGGPCS